MKNNEFINSFNKINYSPVQRDLLFEKILMTEKKKINFYQLAPMVAMAFLVLVLNTYQVQNYGLKNDNYIMESSFDVLSYKAFDETLMTTDCTIMTKSFIFSNQIGLYAPLSNVELNNNYNPKCGR